MPAAFRNHAAIHVTMSAREWGMLLLLSVPWGGSFLFVAIALEALPPVSVAAARVVLAASALVLAMRAFGMSMPKDAPAWCAFFAMGLINNAIPFCLIAWGQMHIASGLASILNATTPLATVILAHFLTADEKLTAPRVAGVVVGLIGVVWMVGVDALGALGTDLLGELAVLAAAVSYAFAGIFGRRFARLGVAPMATASGQLIASSAMLLPLALIVDRPWQMEVPPASVWAALAGLALLSTSLGYVLYFRVLATAGATNLLLVTFLIPVTAILLGTLILGERLAPHHFAGMALIGVGLAVIDGRVWGLMRR